MSTLDKDFTSLLISNRSDSTEHWTLTRTDCGPSIFQDSPGSSLTVMLWCGGTAGERTALTSACRHCQHSTEPVTSGGLTPSTQGPGSNRGLEAHTSLTVIQLIIKQSVSLKNSSYCWGNKSKGAQYKTNRLRYLAKSQEVPIFLRDITKTILLISIKSEKYILDCRSLG